MLLLALPTTHLVLALCFCMTVRITLSVTISTIVVKLCIGRNVRTGVGTRACIQIPAKTCGAIGITLVISVIFLLACPILFTWIFLRITLSHALY